MKKRIGQYLELAISNMGGIGNCLKMKLTIKFSKNYRNIEKIQSVEIIIYISNVTLKMFDHFSKI